ncbi:cytochrome-c oxidase, cbb3-type subunit III [Kordiimonas marina]|uniref:cytochrome-c oxidase, cbb3-type subunit III n=1 Tax=Kordiimonas marina TaxID=2872312 RepID=UPI001FF295BE|nr:cytochrome-c oxidase, cbb3-type subunit III [Kordiimonas marina]MCJ9427751.1 cytochrome-c oxidase, cbb3-type subunit III [Kordiimonas marina]
MSEHNVEKDDISGVETTGHDWDGIKELNNPAPRWWLMVFYVCIAFAIGYWVIYPAWPTFSGDNERGGTKGTMGWTEYKQLKDSQAEILARRAQYLGRFEKASFSQIENDEGLRDFAVAGGKAAFKDNCATCHGTGGAGGNGYPNLNDDDWLWGGKIEDIYQTIRFGIRSGDDEARLSEMPTFGGMLTPKQISDVADFVLSKDNPTTPTAIEGKQVFADNCASCHGEKATGGREVGAPDLVDAIWLYGGTKADIMAQVTKPRHGVMPAWEHRLDRNTIRELAVYVHSLGGGEE